MREDLKWALLNFNGIVVFNGFTNGRFGIHRHFGQLQVVFDPIIVDEARLRFLKKFLGIETPLENIAHFC
jgi:hypothetical protein